MKRHIAYYQIIPTVVPADQTSQIEIRCTEPYWGFKDGVKYYVDIVPYSIPASPFPANYGLLDMGRSCRRVEAVAENGVLKLSFHFTGEQRWRVHVMASEPTWDNPMYEAYRPCWGPHLNAAEQGNILEMFSLNPDLYGLRAYKGDLHIHTLRSDGIEKPATVAANYRKAGYDFISITDHHYYDASREARGVYAGLDTNFVIYDGEEVHSSYIGQLHIVNFDSRWSVNDRILNDREAVLQEVEEIKNSTEVADCTDKLDIAWRIWAYREIKKSGGFAIFPHPYWEVCDAEHASPEVIEYTFRHHLMDAFEVYGGTNYRNNNLQALLYQDMMARGYSYPLVASTDSHCSCEKGQSLFACAATVAFAENAKSVRKAIENGLTVGVQSVPGTEINLTGSLRLSKYADFLLENYFPKHDELCIAAGQMMYRYGQNGSAAAKTACEIAEQFIAEYENQFFG